MKDKDFLLWLYHRLIYVHDEDKDYDYMLKLKAIIDATPEDKVTPNGVTSNHSILYCRKAES
jgi:hypothetical protein